MKVYYDMPDITDISELDENSVDEAIQHLPDSLKELVGNAFKKQLTLFSENIFEKCEKIKYQIMWALRSLENEIDAEGGCIILTKEFKINTRDFTQELTDKIKELLLDFK